MLVLSTIGRLASVLLVVALTACAGHGVAGVVPGAQASEDARRAESANSIAPVVYVSGRGSIYAYAFPSYANTPPVKVLDGEYNAADGTAIAGIATDRKATLYVLVNFGALTAGGPGCHVLEFPAGATQSTVPTVAYRCAPGVFFGAGIAAGPNGEIDVLDTVDNAGQTGFSVERFFPGGGTYATSSLKLKANRPYAAIGAGAAGHLFAGYSAVGPAPARIDKYAPLATGNAKAVTGIDMPPSFPTMYAIASGRGRVWIAMEQSGAAQGSAYVADPALTVLQQSVSTGANAPPTALAVDASGILWFGVTATIDTAVAVYAPVGPIGAMTMSPQGFLFSPVRRPNLAGAYLTGIAIAQ